ncbi:hypothetical protein E2C01_091106 [Portunus trituberculatus]|uniref:Uncharacterized protein n=1 Tax=Portunus trituberculatus TaxID=210409 RepID=A0A5B7JS45_PORTR|nr:hypothetical protein [Portunus trituberculatus]
MHHGQDEAEMTLAKAFRQWAGGRLRIARCLPPATPGICGLPGRAPRIKVRVFRQEAVHSFGTHFRFRSARAKTFPAFRIYLTSAAVFGMRGPRWRHPLCAVLLFLGEGANTRGHRDASVGCF